MESKEHFIAKWKVEDGDELKIYRAKGFIGIIEDGAEIEEFDIDLYFRMIEKIGVLEDRIIVGILEGTAVECIIE